MVQKILNNNVPYLEQREKINDNFTELFYKIEDGLVDLTTDQVIDGYKTFKKYIVSTIDSTAGNPFYYRFQDENNLDRITIGEIGVGNRAPAIKLIGRDLSDEPEFFIGHNETRNYGWITQSGMGDATYIFNRRINGVDHSVYTIKNADGSLSWNTQRTDRYWNVGGDANFQGAVYTDQHFVGSYLSTSPENIAGTVGAFRMANNQAIVSRNSANSANATLIKMSSSNNVVLSEEGWNVLINGDTSFAADIEIIDSSKGIILKDTLTGTRHRITLVSGVLTVSAAL